MRRTTTSSLVKEADEEVVVDDESDTTMDELLVEDGSQATMEDDLLIDYESQPLKTRSGSMFKCSKLAPALSAPCAAPPSPDSAGAPSGSCTGELLRSRNPSRSTFSRRHAGTTIAICSSWDGFLFQMIRWVIQIKCHGCKKDER